MAWETRGNRSYYYTKRKVNGKVISDYGGHGVAGQLMEQLGDHNRMVAQRKRLAWRAAKDEQDTIDRQIDAVSAKLQALVDAAYLVTGHHKHKRMWRRKRASN